MNTYSYKRQIEVCIYDCDAYHVVHHPRYLQWFEESLYELIFKENQLYDESSYRIKIEEVTCRHINAILWGEKINLYTDTWKAEDEEDVLYFRQTIKTDKIKCICQGKLRIICIKQVRQVSE